MSRSASNLRRLWVRDHFYDHPVRDDGSHIYGARASGKTKAACMLCFDATLTELRSQDLLNTAANPQAIIRTDETLQNLLWDSPITSPLILSSHIKSLTNHLISCEHQPLDIRTAAAQQKQTSKANSPYKRRHNPVPSSVLRMGSNPIPLTPIYYPDPSPFHASPSGVSGGSASILLNSPAMGGFTQRLPGSHQGHLPYPILYSNNSRSASPFQPPSNSLSPSNSLLLQPSDSVSEIGRSSQSSGGSLHAPVPPGSFVGSSVHRQPLQSTILPHMIQQQWSDLCQRRFEKRLIRLTASAGFPLSWVDNWEWHAFCEEFIPGAPQISRKVLTQRILRDVVGEFHQEAMRRAKGKEVTMQSDGWTGLNNHHLIAFMITINADSQVQTVEVVDTTKDRKIAENLLEEIEKVYDKLKGEWDTMIVGLVTDASGESRKARKLFSRKHPELIILDCYSHQINLIVGDFCKSKSPILKYVELATDLISWLQSKTRILANLPLAVLRAVLTRWTAHYVAFRRLLHLYPSLNALKYADDTLPPQERVLISGDAAAQRKARSMVEIIKNPTFWHSLALITRYLEPLAIAANITQGSFCRMDQVLLTFGFLVMTYCTEDMNHDLVAQNAILNSIEARWAKADQEVFVATVLVNPFYRTSPFAPLQAFNRAQIRILLTRLYRRFYQSPPPSDFIQHAYDFFDAKGLFAGLESQITHELEECLRQRAQPEPIRVLEGFNIPGRPGDVSSFIGFARRLLSISANSASCERLFSVFGNILTKLRSRTGNTVLTNLAELKMHIHDEHIAAGIKQRLKKRMGASASHVEMPRRPLGQSVDEVINDILQCPTSQSLESAPDFDEAQSVLNAEGIGRFSTIISQHVRSVAEDLDDTEDELPAQVTELWTRVKISELFDFPSSHWSTRYARFARFSFDEELELYDLVDLDGDGEVDLDLDDMTQDILTT